MFVITTKDLIGNAFVSYFGQTGKRILPITRIVGFGEKVISQLKEEGYDAYLDLSRDKSNEFFYNYSHIFKHNQIDKKDVVELVDEKITKEDLIRKFSGYLCLPILLAFRNKENTNALIED